MHRVGMIFVWGRGGGTGSTTGVGSAERHIRFIHCTQSTEIFCLHFSNIRMSSYSTFVACTVA